MVNKDKDWKEAYEQLYKRFKSANHSNGRLRVLKNNKERENMHLRARNRYLMRQMKHMQDKIEKVLKVEKNIK